MSARIGFHSHRPSESRLKGMRIDGGLSFTQNRSPMAIQLNELVPESSPLPKGLFGIGNHLVYIGDASVRIPRRGRTDKFVRNVTALVVAELARWKGSSWRRRVEREALEFLEILELMLEASADEAALQLGEELATAKRKERLQRIVNEARRHIVSSGVATWETVDKVVYDMPVEEFKRITSKWPDLSRVDFKYCKNDLP